jgi:hypothetical protein
MTTMTGPTLPSVRIGLPQPSGSPEHKDHFLSSLTPFTTSSPPPLAEYIDHSKHDPEKVVEVSPNGRYAKVRWLPPCTDDSMSVNIEDRRIKGKKVMWFR